MPNRRFLCWNVTLFMTFVSYGYICECKNEHNDSVRSFIVFVFCANWQCPDSFICNYKISTQVHLILIFVYLSTTLIFLLKQ